MAVKVKKTAAAKKQEPGDAEQAIRRTGELKRVMLPVEQLEISKLNPNEMSDAEFNLLYDNIRRTGMTDPILVRKMSATSYRIIGGAHRFKVAQLMEFKEVPCTVVDAKDFTEDEEKYQMVRHNVIHGKLSPQKFLQLYESLSKKYSEEVAAESFGFVSVEEFKRLIKSTADSLPPEMQEQFKEAAKELKTIDDLAKLLNHLFSTYGDTLPFGYMIFDFGGKESVWLRLETKARVNFDKIAANCKKNSKAADHVIAGLLEHAVANKDLLDSLVQKAKTVKFKNDAPAPTLDFLKQ